jgi:GDPmannose 4,6-dehydratase
MGYRVFGASRDAQVTSVGSNPVVLGIRNNISMLSINLTDFRSVLQGLTTTQPDEVYNLAGQSSVTGEHPANEDTSFRPRSPYAVAKAAAFWEVANYREAYKLFACTGILFNHESPLRPERFVTRKIVAAAARIAVGSKERLRLGNIDIARDWGWAPDYVDAMWRMLQQATPKDYVIATGETRKLSDFIEIAFAQAGLNWQEWVDTDPEFFRPTDLKVGHADPSKALRELGWHATVRLDEVVKRMVAVERGLLSVKEA